MQENGKPSQEFNQNMKELVDFLLKLNPLAKEFIPLSLAIQGCLPSSLLPVYLVVVAAALEPITITKIDRNKPKKIQGKCRLNNRTS